MLLYKRAKAQLYWNKWLSRMIVLYNQFIPRLAEFCSETPRKFWKRCWPENVHIVGRQTYERLKISVNSIIEATQFVLWHQVKYVLKNAFENCFGRQRSLGSRKDNPSMADFRYNNNAITNQKNSNQSLMVMLLIVA